MERGVKITLITVVMLTTLIGISGCLVEDVPKKADTEKISIKQIEKNVEVPFKIGQKFEYEVKGYTSDGDIVSQGKEIYSVKEIKRINSNDCYVINLKVDITIIKPSDYSLDYEEVYYYDKNTGNLKRVNFSNQIFLGKKAELEAMDTSKMFASWMLTLTDDFNYKEDGVYKKIKVIERETVNERECFKVEVETINRRMHIWVDVEKRIIVKEKKFLNNIYERNLISGI
ncbi:MAG: hypothetical protein GW779_01300 [Candidatus Altiarchaeum hamiconexum]|uniref:Uncharacterized protein n=1 Tax=Candidatus Altarchaeum hamiconexum TaxID=1803513 RepID=A0A8J7YTX7_9ARCH|nr:hypothetical protein [Candidatus Altarchaeum hamiconexum]NCT00556.1 hypothetical protein [Candidatus Altarchaeum hamiconexum]OIQ04421.1 MAG: hypothetical protein AUK59_07495 [Candidatus Altarchaeum sp. CG2_30_32_3053]PIX48269.1 MAG: hypothetical protein COZ53_04575 [Candidatus Altarchaeum sp. CG_4_8_14_3_um_filter_33_2054]PJC15898.1 MAG: hypothetical protein CO063_00420 [Candidatus Altarchaeum sp. CG_4_9_14_0_8_um_filter_32_206]